MRAGAYAFVLFKRATKMRNIKKNIYINTSQSRLPCFILKEYLQTDDQFKIAGRFFLLSISVFCLCGMLPEINEQRTNRKPI